MALHHHVCCIGKNAALLQLRAIYSELLTTVVNSFYNTKKGISDPPLRRSRMPSGNNRNPALFVKTS
jgi:hypothetical protein